MSGKLCGAVYNIRHQSTQQGGGYSLASLSADDAIMAAYTSQLQRAKISMKDLFGKPYMKKDGTAGKLTVVPPVDVLQEDPETRAQWVEYSAFDAKATWFLYQALKVCFSGCVSVLAVSWL